MIERLLQTLLDSRNVVIVSHMRPDGDAVGSQMAMGLFLQKLNKNVLLIGHDPVPRNMEWLTGRKRIKVFNGSIRQRERIERADLVVVVDTNAKQRLGDLCGPIEQNGGTKVLIDHHPGPENWFDLSYVDQQASSTGELIYDIIASHDRSLIDREMATALYAAIMTDTGSFQFSNVTPHVHRIAADLLEIGQFNPEPIHDAIFNVRTLGGARLLGFALEQIRVAYNGKLGFMPVYEKMVHRAGANFDETEGFVNYLLSISGVVAGVLFLETERGVKMSFRSKGDYSVTEWARHFGGGGHRNASGAYIEGQRLDEVIPEVIRVAGDYVDLQRKDAGPEAAELSREDARLLTIFRNE